MKNLFREKLVIFLLLVFASSWVWMGCSSAVKERRDGLGKTEGQETTTPSGKSFAKNYYFEDILVPEELNYRPDKSFVYETPQFKAGSMVFTKWQLDVDSLVDFFNYHMEKYNWKIVNSYRGKESLLTFSKPDRICNIRITRNWYGTTQVEMRIGPLVQKKISDKAQNLSRL